MKLILLFVMVGILVMGAGYGYYSYSTKPKDINKQLLAGTAFLKPRAISPFSLHDNQGKAFTNANLKGHWTLMFFGFTHCPHICPTTMMELNKIYQQIKTANIPEPEVMMVSIDPRRDTVKRINSYVKAFNPAFKGAVGKQAELDKLTKSLNVLYITLKPKTHAKQENYDIDHSGSIMLINPEGKLAAIFSMPHDADKIAKDYALIRKVYG